MAKVTCTEEDGKFRFDLDRGRTTLVVILGSAYTGLAVKAFVDGKLCTITYQEAVLIAIQNLDKMGDALVLPKVDNPDDDDNEIEVYEFFN